MSFDTSLQPLDLDLDLEALERAVLPTPRERAGRLGGTVLAWIKANLTNLVVLGVLLVVAAIVHMRGMYTSPARFDDEGTYTAYAWSVQNLHQLSHYTYWYAHPPLGWIQMAIWNTLTDAFSHAPYAVAAERQFMVVAKLVSVALLYGLALRLRMTRVAAAGAVAIFSLSPLAVYFTRTALLDNIVTPWLLGAFFLAASPKRSLRSAAGCGACFAIAVLSKETALLFLPALALLFWQCSDRRNRRFTGTMFLAVMCLLGLLYPLYAVVKNELLTGPGHVSLQWAITWQLSGRQGSGSIFDPHSTAHSVVHTWFVLDPWLPKVALAALPVGLVMRRTRAVALAFAIQAASLLRNGYLPYPFVVAMIPFAALTVAGVLDVIWQACRPRLAMTAVTDRLPPALRDWLGHRRAAERGREPWVGARRYRLPMIRRRGARAARSARHDVQLAGLAGGVVGRLSVLAVVITLTFTVYPHWKASIDDLWHNDRDAGKAAALAWVLGNVGTDQRVVVDDSLWVDLIRHGYNRDRIIWFTKLDVDPQLKLPKTNAWQALDYVVLDHQDQLSVHLNSDGTAGSPTLHQFPTLGKAIKYSQVVGTFGTGLDEMTIWRVIPDKPQLDARAADVARRLAVAKEQRSIAAAKAAGIAKVARREQALHAARAHTAHSTHLPASGVGR